MLATLLLAVNTYAATLTPQEEVRHLIEYHGADLATSTRQVIENVIKCESNFNPLAHNKKENSRGLVQIHKPSWPEISDEQAFNADFSVKFIVDHFRKGNQHFWSCWKKLQ